MPIQTVEILSRRGQSVDRLLDEIRQLIKTMELTHKVKITPEYTMSTDLTRMDKYSLNPSQLPAVIINGQVECTGSKSDRKILKIRLEAIHRMG